MRPSLFTCLYHFNLYTVGKFCSFELACSVVAVLSNLQLFAIENLIQIDLDNADLKKTVKLPLHILFANAVYYLGDSHKM